MNKFLKEHMEWVLGGVTLLFFLVVVWAFVWSIGFLAKEADTALGGGEKPSGLSFDIEGASKLDLKGSPRVP